MPNIYTTVPCRDCGEPVEVSVPDLTNYPTDGLHRPDYKGNPCVRNLRSRIEEMERMIDWSRR